VVAGYRMTIHKHSVYIREEMEKTDINTVIKKKGNKGDGCNIWNES
jgi:hypothetical protein